jgi:hypothetical protein
MLKGRDSKGYLYYECIVEGEEDTKIIRSDNILRGTQPYKCRKWKYNRGSVMNPAMIRKMSGYSNHSFSLSPVINLR